MSEKNYRGEDNMGSYFRNPDSMEHGVRFNSKNIYNEEVNISNNTIVDVLNEMISIYTKKNRDYGNSFDISLDNDGLLASKIRMGDKMNRFDSILRNNGETLVKDESLRDTLIDLALYSVMTVRWLDEKSSSQKGVLNE